MRILIVIFALLILLVIGWIVWEIRANKRYWDSYEPRESHRGRLPPGDL